MIIDIILIILTLSCFIYIVYLFYFYCTMNKQDDICINNIDTFPNYLDINVELINDNVTNTINNFATKQDINNMREKLCRDLKNKL